MTVIDLRELLSKRDVKILSVDSDCIYYTERFSVNNADTIYFYSYDLFENSERLISYVTLKESASKPYFFVTERSIIAVFGDSLSRVLIVRLDKRTKGESFNKAVPIIGTFSSCVMLDDNNIIIYSTSNPAYKDVFDRCFEETGSDIMANMYDLDHSYRYFLRDFRTASLIKNGMRIFTDCRDKQRVLLGGDETCEKIYQISLNDLADGIRSGCERIRLKCIASAGDKGLVSLEYAGTRGIVFSAMSHKTDEGWFVGMSPSGGNVRLLRPKKRKDGISRYFTDEQSNSIFYMTPDGERISVRGEIGSHAKLSYPFDIGQFIGCTDDRYILADGTSDEGSSALVVYDSERGTKERYDARFSVERGNVVVY